MEIEGPYISASKTPTLQPISASVIAMFTVIVDFPTPPLPEDIAIIESIPFIGFPFIILSVFLSTNTSNFTIILAFS